ncbi:MAG: C2H2-type zinc finger protein [Candidatus Thermoplasmatota archaeon]|nr:C2H2-type zinc finger protein [Candidatus Thermoplasmatota archaeon]
MAKTCRCIYCGRKFRTYDSLKDHMIKFGTHV